MDVKVSVIIRDGNGYELRREDWQFSEREINIRGVWEAVTSHGRRMFGDTLGVSRFVEIVQIGEKPIHE